MNGELFPLWQVDRREYAQVCVYLGVEPDDAIFDRLSRHLATLPFDTAALRGLARHLAQPALTPFRLARLDQATRLFFPDHPVRHVLNATLALHECHGPSFRSLSRTVTGGGVWWALAGWGLRCGGGLALTLPWLVWQALAWTLTRPFVPWADVAGRVVLVTGVARGLGRDLMLELLQGGARVVGTVRHDAARQALAAALPASAPLQLVAVDLSQPGALPQALDAAGVSPHGLDMVVACAGTKHSGRSALALDAVRETAQVNWLAAVELAAWFAGGRPQAGQATEQRPAITAPPPGAAAPRRLVVVSSMGRWHGMQGSGGYNASKAALSIWAESAELDLQRAATGRYTLTVVEPGLFASGMTQARGLVHWLAARRRSVAQTILAGAMAGRRSVRPPFWFALVTWTLCLAGRGIRARVFGRVKPGAE